MIDKKSISPSRRMILTGWLDGGEKERELRTEHGKRETGNGKREAGIGKPLSAGTPSTAGSISVQQQYHEYSRRLADSPCGCDAPEYGKYCNCIVHHHLISLLSSLAAAAANKTNSSSSINQPTNQISKQPPLLSLSSSCTILF